MPIIKSAKKRVSVSAKATARNVKSKRSLRTALKQFQASLITKNAKKISDAQGNVQSELDKMLKKNILHKNKVARQKAQISKQAKAAGGAKPMAKKPAAKKTITKKPAVKKTIAKKPSAKKAVVKKSPPKK